MKLSKQEIEEELDHKRQVLTALVRRRRPLELQAAQKGLSTPPETLTEITALVEQIHIYEEEIAQLQTLAAEDTLSINEVEYRVMLAKVWDTPRGRPTLAGVAELELARLKMGLLTPKAQQIEHDVRIGLAEEAFSYLDSQFLDFLPEEPEIRNVPSISSDTISVGNIIGTGIAIGEGASITHISIKELTSTSNRERYAAALENIGRAIRLDNTTALRLFKTILPPSLKIDLQQFSKQLIEANRVWNYQEDWKVFEWFLNNLSQERRTTPCS